MKNKKEFGEYKETWMNKRKNDIFANILKNIPPKLKLYKKDV